jgi:hypothetical protein
MSIKIKSQKDFQTTKVSLELPADLQELDSLMRSSNATGTIVATYNQGGLMGVNIEQNKHIPEKIAEQVRDLVGVTSKEIG